MRLLREQRGSGREIIEAEGIPDREIPGMPWCLDLRVFSGERYQWLRKLSCSTALPKHCMIAAVVHPLGGCMLSHDLS